MLPIILGFAGKELTQDERDFFKDVQPFGYILFQRNVESPEQLKRLTDELRHIAGRSNVPVLIDQEGARVQKLRPPYWLDMPDMRTIGDLFSRNSLLGLQAVQAHAQITAGQLIECGINTICAPVVDVPVSGAHDVIGDRAFSTDVEHVITMASVMAKEFLRHGITPVIKHIPGHGRADKDSHYACPVVRTDKETLEKTDFKAFKQVALQVGKEKVWAMTAHVVFAAIDNSPASISKKTIELVRNDLNIEGPIVADTIEMNALGGSLPERALATLAAGCDAFLFCSGKLNEAQTIAAHLPPITIQALARFNAAQVLPQVAKPVDWRERYEFLKQVLGVNAFRPYRSKTDITEALHR